MSIDYDQLGFVARRRGNRVIEWTPRNTYKTIDNRWFVVSSVGSATMRLFRAIGRDDIANDETLLVYANRVARADEIDSVIAHWGAEHTLAEVLEAFEKHDVIGGPVYDIEQLFADPHVRERNTFTTVDDPVLGQIRLQDVVPRFTENPGKVCWPGPHLVGADTTEVLKQAGYSDVSINELEHSGVIKTA
jgi:crotonobetainyl-CoA:carnitine CoA-transferase CaiB-like acyl-CoA transferase